MNVGSNKTPAVPRDPILLGSVLLGLVMTGVMIWESAHGVSETLPPYLFALSVGFFLGYLVCLMRGRHGKGN